MSTTQSLSPAAARRVVLAAQGFLDRAPTGVPTMRHVGRVFGRLGLIQMDSVNVLQRAHYLPLYSRLGPYPTGLLDRAAYRRPRTLFEYWGHEASLLPVSSHPLMRWRMAMGHQWGGVRRLAKQRPGFIDWVRDEVRGRGPMTAAQIEDDVPRRSDNWGWNWSDVKTALEWLFWTGEVVAAERTTSFARRYDIPERVLPADVLAAPTPQPADAQRELVRIAARALGVATEPDLRDYFRLPVAGTAAAVRDLVDAGELLPVTIPGWRRPTYLHHEARLPRRVNVATLVSPFDPLVWQRQRTERLFDFSYRIEIYVPAGQRVYGYYVLPFLLGDRFVGRVDLKADRQASALRVLSAHSETAAPEDTAATLAAELRRLAGWLGLAEVVVGDRGDLAGPVAAELDAAERDTGPPAPPGPRSAPVQAAVRAPAETVAAGR